jgi:hypothetical protein
MNILKTHDCFRCGLMHSLPENMRMFSCNSASIKNGVRISVI